jgi:hypothetical protein
MKAGGIYQAFLIGLSKAHYRLVITMETYFSWAFDGSDGPKAARPAACGGVVHYKFHTSHFL